MNYGTECLLCAVKKLLPITHSLTCVCVLVGQSLLDYLCEMIPKLKSRSQGGASSQSQASSGGGRYSN